MPGDAQAINNATRLSEIGFPEFTAKLIIDTFDALVAANLSQTKAYIELLQQVGKTLTTFINDTKDNISGEQILQFLGMVVPNANKTNTAVVKDETLSQEDADKLTEAVKITDVITPTIPAGQITDSEYKTILDAVASRIAADKYTLLKEMVKLGILRLVVENGVIETRLTFNTFGSTFYESTSNDYRSQDFNFQANVKTGGFLSNWINASASTEYSRLTVSSVESTQRDTTGSQVQIYGSVKVQFKTDYLPLNQ